MALHGCSLEAIELFDDETFHRTRQQETLYAVIEEMQACGVWLDEITFTGLLSTCSHSVLVDLGNITFFCANVFFRNFDIKSSADELLIYLTMYINVALKRLEDCGTLAEGTKAIINLGLEKVPVPGEYGNVFAGERKIVNECQTKWRK
ncbi:Actin-related protein 2/3 complex subunit 3 [Morella rubra]|uniref:Actin-related protein 2/3 complex subunit 3 n=1 Tax=Morella rubra TaxID=262757 RepID=A0A6A1UXN6_9ROSI|nr:Actin-related protein 2/3 complex subunit 3 [Morella rubra]